MGNADESAVKTLKGIAALERVITGPSPADYCELLHALRKAFAIELEDLDFLKEDDPDLYDLYQLCSAF